MKTPTTPIKDSSWEKRLDNLPQTGMTTKDFIKQELSTQRSELLQRIEEEVEDGFMLGGIVHACNEMKGFWMNKDEILAILAKLRSEG